MVKTIALVGCGRISKRHIEAIKDNPGLEIATVCDIIEERAQATAAELGCSYTTDFHTIRDVDVISVLTPSGLHPRHASEIAESTNVPNIIIEKPLSLTLREAYELFNRVDKTGKRILPVYQNRYNPLVAYIKKLISEGHLGTIYQFVCNVLWNRNDQYFAIDWHGTQELDGGVLYTQASHYVDMLHFFFGEIQDYKGFGANLRNLETYDTVSAVCRFKNGVVGTLNATVNAYPTNYRTEITIIAEKGVIRLAGTNLNEIEHWTVEGLEKPNMDFSINHQYGKGHNTLYSYVQQERWDMFPSRQDVLSGIKLMEQLSY